MNAKSWISFFCVNFVYFLLSLSSLWTCGGIVSRFITSKTNYILYILLLFGIIGLLCPILWIKPSSTLTSISTSTSAMSFLPCDVEKHCWWVFAYRSSPCVSALISSFLILSSYAFNLPIISSKPVVFKSRTCSSEGIMWMNLFLGTLLRNFQTSLDISHVQAKPILMLALITFPQSYIVSESFILIISNLDIRVCNVASLTRLADRFLDLISYHIPLGLSSSRTCIIRPSGMAWNNNHIVILFIYCDIVYIEIIRTWLNHIPHLVYLQQDLHLHRSHRVVFRAALNHRWWELLWTCCKFVSHGSRLMNVGLQDLWLNLEALIPNIVLEHSLAIV